VIDEKITSLSPDYSFARISRVEKTILRLGVYEILFDDLIPPLVAISEAIRLTRKFGTPESARFVNAILDRVYHAIPAKPALI
jgi:N utilization substance protein B